MNGNATTLFRPVGQAELDLIRDSDWKRFPPRLYWQPIFYPVLSEEYAVMIARDWNTRDAASGYVGYVLKFAIHDEYLSQFSLQQAGGRDLMEYWIPSDQLDTFNDHIVGSLEVIHEFHA